MISVCMAAWKRQEAITRLISNLVQQYGELLPLELCICDDGSIPPMVPPTSRSVIPTTVTYLPQKAFARNPCVPINQAVAASRGEIIVLTNPEVEHPTPVLVEMLQCLHHSNDYVIAPCRDTRGPWVAGPETKYGTRGRGPIPPGGHYHFLVMFYRALWEKAGGFDEAYRDGQGWDDNDWLWRVYAAGGRFHTVRGHAIHTPSYTKWAMVQNRTLFFKKWPEALRTALIAERETPDADAEVRT